MVADPVTTVSLLPLNTSAYGGSTKQPTGASGKRGSDGKNSARGAKEAEKEHIVDLMESERLS